MALLACGLTMALLAGCGAPEGSATPEATPSLVVTTVSPVTRDMERTLTASGSVAAWQEMSLGVELTGIRVAEVLVEVGDEVRAGQTLLRLDSADAARSRPARPMPAWRRRRPASNWRAPTPSAASRWSRKA